MTYRVSDEQLEGFLASDLHRRQLLGYLAGTQIAQNLKDTRRQIETLYEAIAHGDDDHKEWLREAIGEHFAGRPAPPPRGQGTTDRLRGALERIVNDADVRYLTCPGAPFCRDEGHHPECAVGIAMEALA